MVKVAPLAVPQLVSCASSGRAWRLWPARRSQGEAQPLGVSPLPRVREPPTSKVTDSTAFGHAGMAERTNWLGVAIADDAFGKVLLAAGIPEATLKKWSSDPQVTYDAA